LNETGEHSTEDSRNVEDAGWKEKEENERQSRERVELRRAARPTSFRQLLLPVVASQNVVSGGEESRFEKTDEESKSIQRRYVFDGVGG